MSTPASSSGSSVPLKRPRGRPRGTKNGPNVGPVGRPRKDAGNKGSKKNKQGNISAATSKKNAMPSTVEHNAAPQLATDLGSAGKSTENDDQPQSLDTPRPDINLDVTSLAITSLASRLPDIDDETIELNADFSQPQVPIDGHNTPKLSKGSHWSPPHGMGLGSNTSSMSMVNEMPDLTGNDDENLDYLLANGPGGEGEEETEEFKPIPDDDKNIEECEKLQQTRATLPMWLNQNYADTRERLASEIANNSSHCPTCYDWGTFVDGPSSACFLTTKKFQPLLNDFYCPKYFVWLPHLLCLKIPCPAYLADSCKAVKGGIQYLNAKGWLKHPRRVVDVEECIFIIGYCYACPNPVCRKSYQSWSPELLLALPRLLSIHFTHHLTYRRGLTNRVVALMQSCFQHGIGPGPFLEMIRTQHLRQYEQLHMQYLETILICTQSATGHFLSKFEPFGLFNDQNGYAGFTPSLAYFRSFYVRFISLHAMEMDQHMAMLSAEVLQIDHSFKVIFFLCYSFFGNFSVLL
ncbi:hypothetical protein C0992_007401 [Termitomyces sp. T32_za158]|nr:hypothetical protein C0992_007401 [Termitomyces sp. T32_za158]